MKKRLWTIVALLCLGILVSQIYFAILRAKDAAEASTCYGTLTGIAIAMHNYHEKYGSLPPAFLTDISGKPAHSWRVLLLEFLDPSTYAAYNFNEPWDGPNNSRLESRMPYCYACPADGEGKSRWRTNYFVAVGEKTAFPGVETVSLEQIERPRSSTILVVESVGQNVHWMEPKDLSYDSMSFILDDKSKPSVSSKHRNGPIVCMVDGTKQRLNDVSAEMLQEMLLIKPAEKER